MKSPVQIYNETAEKFKVTGEKQLHVRQKLAYIEEQLGAMQHIANRLLCDVTVAQIQLQQAKDETTEAAIKGKIQSFESDLRQTSTGMEHYIALQKEFGQELKASGEEL